MNIPLLCASGDEPAKTKVIVAVSGGADSVALLDLLYRSGYVCVVAHCNFHLRGEESDRDESFVRDMTCRYNLPFRKIDFKTAAYASLKGISIEMAARELRYDWFRELREREAAQWIAVAHHSDDEIETFLMNASRGTGLRGLSGMPRQNGFVCRPLMDYSRKDILDYLLERKLSHVEDSTNAETVYMRNKFRNQIIPLIESAYPSAKKNILHTIEYLSQAEATLMLLMDEKKKILLGNCNDDEVRISLDLLRKELLTDWLYYEFFSSYGFPSVVIDRIKVAVEGGLFGLSFYSKKKDYHVRLEREELLLMKWSKSPQKDYVINSMDDFSSLPICLDVHVVNAADLSFDKSASVCYLDADRLDFPLVVRHWRDGDWFCPFGMKGKKKKLSDYFIDQKMSESEKENVWLLTRNDSIVWVIGYRSDNRYRVNTDTDRVCVIRVKQ